MSDLEDTTTNAPPTITAPGYQIQWNTERRPEYEDGFANGYSRAWQECWEYLRSIAKDELEQTATTAGAKE